MSTINFNFFRFYWKFIFIGQFFILICNFRIIFLVVYCVVFYNKTLRWMALRRSHFQCGKCEGRRSQSSVARTPSLALPPRWARKEFCVVDFCLYAAVLRMERCADLVSVFFGTYGGTLCRSAICSLYSSILIGIFCTSLTFQDRTPSPFPSPACFFLSVGSVSQRKVASGRAAAEKG